MEGRGLGGFFGSDTSDMLLRDGNNGAFEVYDISNNNITNAAAMGQVGLEWSVPDSAISPAARRDRHADAQQ